MKGQNPNGGGLDLDLQPRVPLYRGRRAGSVRAVWCAGAVRGGGVTGSWCSWHSGEDGKNGICLHGDIALKCLETHSGLPELHSAFSHGRKKVRGLCLLCA